LRFGVVPQFIDDLLRGGGKEIELLEKGHKDKGGWYSTHISNVTSLGYVAKKQASPMRGIPFQFDSFGSQGKWTNLNLHTNNHMRAFGGREELALSTS